MHVKKIVLSLAVLSLLGSLAISAETNTQDVNKNGNFEVVKGKTKHHKATHKNYSANNNVSLEKQVQELRSEVFELKNQKTVQMQPKREAAWLAYLHEHGPMLMTSPEVPVVSKEDGSDLYINMPSVREDYALLKARQKTNKYYLDNGITQDRPVIVFSGDVEGQVQYDRDYIDPTRITVDLTSAELEMVAEVNPWVSGLMLFSYNNQTFDYIVGQMESTLYLNRGYVNFGNLDKFPLYFTIGQFYVPFGNFGNYMITTPLTQALGRVKARAIELGFEAAGFYGAVYGFHGHTFVDNNSTLNDGGADLGYKYSSGKFSTEISVSAIANIAEAEGMLQSPSVVYGNPFNGFLQFLDSPYPEFNSNTLKKYVPAGDIFGSVTYDQFTLQAEYLAAFKAFDGANLSFQTFDPGYLPDDITKNDPALLRGARISALDIEGVYNFNFYTKPSFISAGYGRSWEALAFDAPEQSFFVSLSSSLLKSTREAIEYRHDINYSSGDYANGALDALIHPIGRKNRDLVTLSLKFFF